MHTITKTKGPLGKDNESKVTEYRSLQQASPLQELTCYMGPQPSHGRGDIPAFTPAKYFTVKEVA